MFRRAVLLACCLVACATPAPQVSAPDGGVAGGGAPHGPDKDDSDHDGVCDKTEEEYGSNSHALDSDNDGLPDFVEIANGYNPVDPDDPSLDQVGFLESMLGATYDFDVRTTVDGDGENHSGDFQDESSADSEGLTAGSFFTSAIAVSAEPPDNVHSVDASTERFTSVVGHTRLSFRLRFEYRSTENFECVEAFPFTYSVKTEAGKRAADQPCLLVVVPQGSTGREANEYCLPATCL